MTTQVFKQVSPILAGYDSKILIKFSQRAWQVMGLDNGRLVSQFRTEIDAEEVLHEADSDDNTIERNPDEHMIMITVPGSASRNWEHRAVVFDLVRMEGTAFQAVPGIWRWPVRQRVTRDVV